MIKEEINEYKRILDEKLKERLKQEEKERNSEKEFSPKRGDFLVRKSGSTVFIYSGGSQFGVMLGCERFLIGRNNDIIDFNEEYRFFEPRDDCRYAIAEEKYNFLTLLAEKYNIIWDEEKKSSSK